MALIYCTSLDHYGGPYNIPAFDNGSSDMGYAIPSDLKMVGDGWSGQPALGSNNAARPLGSYRIIEPSWGARRGDFCLMADQVCIDRNVLGGSQYTVNGGESMRMAIPGSSQDVRILHFAFSMDTLPVLSTNHGMIVALQDLNGVARAYIGVSPTGRLVIYDGNTWASNNSGDIISQPNILSQTTAPVFEAETWYSVNVVIETGAAASGGGTTADLEVWVGDIAVNNKVLDLTGLAFTNTGQNNIDAFGWLPPSMAGASTSTDEPDFTQRCVRDIVVADNTGSYNNSALGEVFVAAQEMRTEDGTNWTPQPRENIGEYVLSLSDVLSANNGARVGDNAALEIAAQDFCIEGFFRFSDLPGASEEHILLSKWDETSNAREYKLSYDGSDDTLRWTISTDGSAETVIKSYPFTFDLNTWYHIAINRASNVTQLFVDGVERGVGTADANTYNTGAANFGLGARYDGTTIASTQKFNGFMNEVRLTVGSSRYTSNFTPPVTAFPRSVVAGDADFANVGLLIGPSSVTVVDESDNSLVVTTGTNVAGFEANDADAMFEVLNQRPAWDDTFIEAENTFATGVLTISVNPTNNDTMTIGAQTYTYVTTLSGAADEILIGVDFDTTIANTIAAINAAAGAGTIYGTGTTANLSAAATLLPSPQIFLVALSVGATGNSVATTETFTDAGNVFDAATLTGGQNIPAAQDFVMERLPVDVTGVLGVQFTARAFKTEAGTADLRMDLKGPGGAVDTGTASGTDLSPSWQRQIFEEDPDTSATITPATIVGGRARVTRTA